MIALMCITDGRQDYLKRTIDSLRLNVNCRELTHRVLINDNPDPKWEEHLDRSYWPHFDSIQHIGGRGFSGAIQAGWDWVRQQPVEWVFHLEDDFIFNEAVDLNKLKRVLQKNPHIAQIVLKRQPWNWLEQQCGGVIQQNPDAYTSHEGTELKWTTHREYWSTNPSLYSAEWPNLFEWPPAPDSERVWSDRLLKNPDLQFAYWGLPDDSPIVTHIGHERTGHGY